jgi:integrase
MVFLMDNLALMDRWSVSKLYAINVSNAKAQSRDYKLADGEGLYLLVRTNGRKSWRMNYRMAGSQKTLSFGNWPEVSLSDARERRNEARKLIARGVDPNEQEKRNRAAERLAAANTFKAVAEEWVAKNVREGLAQVTLDKIRWLLAKAYPKLGSRPIAQITAQDVLTVLRSVEATGRYESARRMRSVLSRVFRYGIATARAERDPAGDLRGALTVPKVKHLAAITTTKGAGAIMRAIDGYDGHLVTRFALRLTPHLFVRPGELRKAEWSEFDYDKAEWAIPAEKMKMRMAHRVPLSRQVLEMLEELHALTGEQRYLFPSFQSAKRPMCENTINLALRRMGYGPDEMTAHGFRAMAATLLNEMGLWNPDAIERQLAHMENNGVRRAYTRGAYWDERVRMMQHWSDHLDKLRAGDNVARPTFGRSRHAQAA